MNVTETLVTQQEVLVALVTSSTATRTFSYIRTFDQGKREAELGTEDSPIFPDDAEFTGPQDYEARLERQGEGYRLAESETGRTYLFDSSGRMTQSTSREFLASGRPGVEYVYDAFTGRLSSVLTPQGWLVEYSYENELLTKIEVHDGLTPDDNVIQKVEYTYFNDAVHSADLGSAGDLVQVKVSRQVSSPTPDIDDPNNWIVRYTQYRYYDDGVQDFDNDGLDDGMRRQLKSVFEADAVERLRVAQAVTPDALLSLDDNEIVINSAGGSADGRLRGFASRSFTYYTNNVDTAGFVSLYGGEEADETHSGPAGYGKVKTEVVGNCSACGGDSDSGIELRYAYMNLNRDVASEADPNRVVKLVVEDTYDGDSPRKLRYRQVFGLNFRSIAIRKAFIESPEGSVVEDPNVTSPRIWCESYKLDDSNEGVSNDRGGAYQVVQRRMPSAHTGVNATNLPVFLSGLDASGTLNTDSGLVYHYRYELTDQTGVGRRIYDTLASEGSSGTQFFVSAVDYGNGQGAPSWQRIAEHTYRDQTTTRGPVGVDDGVAGGRVTTRYEYTFYDAEMNQVDVKTTTLSSRADQNGPGEVELRERYDTLGRKTWSQDGEGYYTTYQYDQDTGGITRTVVDAPRPTGAPVRDASLPTPLEVTTSSVYDNLGRRITSTSPESDANPTGAVHETRYFRNGVVRYPYVVGEAPTLPAQATYVDDGGQLLASFGINGADISVGEYPAIVIGPDSTTSEQELAASGSDLQHLVSLTINTYTDLDGDLASTDRYFDITSGGKYRTTTLYDNLGRRGATVQEVAPNKHQVTAYLYDDRNRLFEVRQGVENTVTPSDDCASLIGTTPAAGYARLSQTIYDDGGVGDSHITASRSYYRVTPEAFTEMRYTRTYRNHVRAYERFNSNTSLSSPGPHMAQDIDWLGRPIAMAYFETPQSVAGDYQSFVATGDTPSAGGSFNTQFTEYDDWGNVYQTRSFSGFETTKHFVTNNYYNRRSEMVATGDLHSEATEYAYDGARRQYQQRVVLQTSGAYAGGVYNYATPAPNPDFTSITGASSGGIVELSHYEFDDYGNTLAMHEVDANHDEANGFTLSGGQPTGGVRSTMHYFYDQGERRVASVNHGAGADLWQSTALSGVLNRDAATTPTPTQVASERAANNQSRLVMFYGYDEASRQNSMTDPAGIETRTFYDDLSRRAFVVENWQPGFNPPGNVTESDQNRTTGWQYNGLSNVTELTAYNNSTANQVTQYQYDHPQHANLATTTIYPDGDNTNDNVLITYELDGRIATRRDQRGVVMEYSYDGARRTTLQAAATITTGVDDTVRAIGRTYDPFGRVTDVTSYAGASDTSAVRNQISYTYDTNHGRLIETHQAHTGAVDTSTTPSVQYAYDDSAPGDVYDNGLRMTETRYPAVTGGRTTYDYGADNSLSDRLNRFDSQTLEDGGLGAGNRAHTTSVAYNGVSRLVRAASDGTSTALDYSDGGGVYAGWDRFGRTVRQEWRQGSSAIDRFDYSYDFASNRLTRETPLAPPAGFGNGSVRDQTYTYDGLHRLRSSDEFTSANDRYWELDQLGNWDRVSSDGPDIGGPQQFEQTRQHNAANELTSVSNWANPTHDAAGNMTTIPQPKNPSSSYAARYDAWNRLASLDNGSAAAYEYDGLHRRTTRTEAGVAKHFYYNERWQVLTETDGAGTATAIYSYHPHYVDAIAVRMTPDADHFYLCDALASVTTVVDNETDAVVERYHYSPYGRITVLDADYAVDEDNTSDIGNEHLYTGRRTDPGTGLQINRHRYYHAALGRWVNRDPTEYEDGPNLYLYAHSTPAIITDPSGLQGHIGYCGGKRYTKNTKNCCNGELKSKGKSCDEHELIDMCKGDPGCEDDVEDLIDILRDTPPPGWFDLDRIKYGGSCVTWKLRVMEKYWDKKDDGDLQNLSCSGKRKYYHGVNPFWSEHHWVQITFPDGGQCFADDDTLGGNDHIFFDYDDEIFNNQQHSGCGCVRDNVYIPPELPPEYNFHLDPPGP